MYRGYLVYGVLVLMLFGYAQYRGWNFGSDDGVSGSRGGGGHWWSGGSSGDGHGGWGGIFHK